MSTDKPDSIAPAPKLAPPTIIEGLSHLAYLGYVNAEGFKDWAYTNPGGVCQLVRALVASLPDNNRAYFHIYDSLNPPPAALPRPQPERRESVAVIVGELTSFVAHIATSHSNRDGTVTLPPSVKSVAASLVERCDLSPLVYTTPPPPSDADDLAGQIADIAWDFLVAAGYTDEDFDAIPLTVIRDNLSQRKGEKAPPSDAAQGLERCPDGCYRPKARNAADCAAGCCSKWYAVRDSEAAAECSKLAAFWTPPSPPVRVDEPRILSVEEIAIAKAAEHPLEFVTVRTADLRAAFRAHKGEGNG
jgi:hypothetical protein